VWAAWANVAALGTPALAASIRCVFVVGLPNGTAASSTLGGSASGPFGGDGDNGGGFGGGGGGADGAFSGALFEERGRLDGRGLAGVTGLPVLTVPVKDGYAATGNTAVCSRLTRKNNSNTTAAAATNSSNNNKSNSRSKKTAATTVRATLLPPPTAAAH